MGQSNIVVFSFGTFLGKVFSKDRIPMANVFGCIVKRISQIHTNPQHPELIVAFRWRAVYKYYFYIIRG